MLKIGLVMKILLIYNFRNFLFKVIRKALAKYEFCTEFSTGIVHKCYIGKPLHKMVFQNCCYRTMTKVFLKLRSQKFCCYQTIIIKGPASNIYYYQDNKGT